MAAHAPRSTHSLLLQSILIANTSPKTILSYIAFLPQFVGSHLSTGLQLPVMCGILAVTSLITDSGYALLAGRTRLKKRITGALLLGTGRGA